MPIMHVEMFEGRTNEQKRELVDELTDTFVRICGSRKEQVYVVIQEVAKENWGIGGNLAADMSAGND